MPIVQRCSGSTHCRGPTHPAVGATVGGPKLVELEGIEPSSAKCSTTVLRPFPSLRLCGYRSAGSKGLASSAGSFPEVSVLSRRQRSFPAVHHRFCCRAAVNRPRVPSLVARYLFSSCYQAARARSTSESASVWLPRFKSLSNSGRTPVSQPQRRNRSAPGAPCQYALARQVYTGDLGRPTVTRESDWHEVEPTGTNVTGVSGGGPPPWPVGFPYRHRVGRWPGACRGSCARGRSPARAWPGR